MSIALMMIGDGREDYHERAYASIIKSIGLQTFDQLITVDDHDHQLGFAGAIQHGWEQVRTDYVLHMEMDFTFLWPIELEPIVRTLEERRYLTQIALLRQPENEAEIAAGGVMQTRDADAFEQITTHDGRAWIEHRCFFTTNPSVYPYWIVERGWPQAPESEGRFGLELFEQDPARRAAYWGHGEQWVRHIGDERAGRGY